MVRGPGLFPQAKKRHRVFRGLTERQERFFTWIAAVVVILFIAGWTGAILETRRRDEAEDRAAAAAGRTAPPPVPTASPARQITNAISDSSAPKAAYITDAMMSFLAPLRGQSGQVK